MSILKLPKSKKLLMAFPATVSALIVIMFLFFSMSPVLDEISIGGAQASLSDEGNSQDCYMTLCNFNGHYYELSETEQPLVKFRAWHSNNTELWQKLTTIYVDGNITSVDGTVYIDQDAFLLVGVTANTTNLNTYFRVLIRIDEPTIGSQWVYIWNSSAPGNSLTYSSGYTHTFSDDVDNIYTFDEAGTYTFEVIVLIYYDNGGGGSD